MGNCISEQLRRKAAVEVVRVGCAAYDAIPPRAIYSDITIDQTSFKSPIDRNGMG